MTDAEMLVAGGLVPVASKLANLDTVGARAYRHAVLGDRVVVRLSAETLAAGDDLEMDVLGFAAPEVRGAVAKAARRPLGFPGWALVHEPKLARHALAVVKELKKWQRRAKSKPGAAKDGIEAIAKKLGKTVPQFLPSFYEEAGRAFLAHGSPKFAASCFGKARDAEGVHGLEVDEAHRVAAFLEFALAGAVTTKALSQYATELGEHRAPAEAYAHFRELCVRRTLGGMPPWAGMPSELRRLTKAAGLDPDAEDARLAKEIIEAPSLAKAPGEVWRAYAAPIAALAKGSASVRAVLLELFPTGADLDDAWLDLVAFDAAPPAGWAAWFDKLTKHLTRSWRTKEVPARMFAVLEQLAPALIAEGAPIHGVGRWLVELDLLERALELGVPVARAPDARLDLARWAKGAVPRDPVRVAAHPALGKLLAEVTGVTIGKEPFDGVSAGMAGFAAAKRAWLDALVASVEKGGLVDVAEALALIAAKVRPEVFAAMPDLHARLAAAELAPALARSLRIGIFDEFGWPALEEAVAEVGADPYTVHGGVQAAIIATATRVIAVDATRRLGAHDLVMSAKQQFLTARFIDGQFLVARKDGYALGAYWSGAPHESFVDEQTSFHWVPAIAMRAVALPDGGWMECDQVIRAGDRKLPKLSRLAAFDGATGWVHEWSDGAHRLRELSLRGQRGRESWPAFLEGGEGKLDVPGSYVLAMGLAGSPLGAAGGVTGIRARVRDGVRELTRIDGVTWRGSAAVSELLDVPGGEAPRAIIVDGRVQVLAICDPSGEIRGSLVGANHLAYARGSVAPLPASMWPAMVPRDPAGSARLRAITDADAKALMAAAADGGWDDAIASAMVGEVAGILPEVAHPRLRLGIAGLAAHAAKLARDLVAVCAVKPVPAVAVAGASDEALHAALGGWVPHSYGPDGRAVAQIARVAELFAGDRADRRERGIAGTRFEWFELALAPNALVTLAVAIGTPAEHRRDVAELYALIARNLPPPERLRIYDATSTAGIADYTIDQVWFEVRWHAGNAFAIRHTAIHGNHYRVLQYAPDGVFAAPPGGLQPDKEVRGTARAPIDIAAVLEVAATSWSASAAAQLATATGLTAGEAALLWAGCPRLNNRGATFLSKELRETLGVKANQAAVARDALWAKPLAVRRAVMDAAGRAGVAALLDGSAVAAMAAAWTREVGARVPIPEALVATADREVSARMEPAAALAMIAAAETALGLNVDGIWALDVLGNVIRARSATPLVGQTAISAPPAFTTDELQAVVAYIPLLFAELPVGDALRGKIAVVHARTLARLANPALLLEAGSHYPEGGKGMAELARLLDTLGGKAVELPDKDTTGIEVRGAVVLRGKHMAELVVRPAEIDARTPKVIAALAALTTHYGHAPLASIAALRSPDYVAFVARVGKTPVPAGGWEQDPTTSVPALVTRAGRDMKITADAAALYLMYLALLWPTPKRIVQWTSWPAKRVAAANAALVARELVVVAKRERAQRTHFLPGGWEALKSPHAPLETWKLPLYVVGPQAGWTTSLPGALFAPAPFHVMFERAWARIAAGDVPAYDKVTKKVTKR